MYYNQEIVMFGFSDFAIEVVENIDTKSITIIDIDKEAISKAENMGYNTQLIDLDNEDELQSIIDSKSFLFCLSDDEALNIFMIISVRSFNKNVNIIALALNENVNKFLLAGANKVIDPYEITANKIFDIIQRPLVVELLDSTLFSQSDLEMAQLEIPSGSSYEGKHLDECDFDKYNLLVTGIIDKRVSQGFLFATGHHSHTLDSGDIVVVLGKNQDIMNIKKELGI
jgi:voltage-gated potassium channel